MQLHNLHVVVVGGAIGGATTALLLARHGARVTMLERIAHPRSAGAAISIAPNGMAVLESLGLAPALLPYTRTVTDGRIVDGDRRLLLAMPDANVMMVRRAALHNVLLDAVAAEPQITTHFGAEVMGVDRDGSVTAHTPSDVLNLQADLVVGADGVHSRVRHAGPFDARVVPSGIPYVRALIDGEHGLNEEAWTSAGLFGSFNVDGRTYLYASATAADPRAALLTHDLNGFRWAWERAYAPAGELLRRVGSWNELLVDHVVRVQCRQWFDGALVLLGDAAHAMAPNLGQGANSALVDAAVLLDELRRAESLPRALAAYQQRRKPVVTRVADASARLGALAERTDPTVRWMRDRLLMPVVRLFAGRGTGSLVLQEDPRQLLQIGSACVDCG